MDELEKTARELILAITEKTLKTLNDKGLLKEPSKLQMLCSSPEMKSLIKKISAPKYDQNRKFCKGDKVRIVERNGRYQPNIPVDEFWSGLLTVSEDEDFCNNLVKVRSADGREKLSHWWYLELVTPVEELEPYSVSEATVQYLVEEDNKKVVAQFCKLYHPHAKAAAEAERDRLNAEYRKEREND